MAPEKISEESSDSEKSIDLEMESCCSSERPLHDCRDLSLSSSSSSPLSYTNDQDYQHHVLSLVNNNVINNRYHSISGGNSSTSNKTEHVSCSSQCPCPSSASVSNYTSCSSSTATPEPEFPVSIPNDGLREQEDAVKFNLSTFPKNIVNINSMKGDLALVPRTVPCVVLSPPVIFSPTMYTSVSSPNTATMPLQLTKKQSYATRDLIEEKSDVHGKKTDSIQSDTIKPLAFGIDRILSNERSTNVRKEATIYPMSVPEEDTSKSHRHHNHQHQHANYLNLSQCSECFYLSRYCRSVQFPVATPAVASASASYSWVTTPSVYEGSTLLSPTGFQHTSMAGSYSISGNNSFSAMPSMVSCNTAPGGRRKRSWSRAVFSNLQRKGLEKRFQIQKYITKPDRRQLAATLGLTDAQVKVWFQNRRMKWRHSKEGKNCGGVGEELMTSVSSNNPTVAMFSEKK